MKNKAKSTEMATLRQKRYPSGNEDLGMTTAIPRSTEYDLEPAASRTKLFVDDEFTSRVRRPGNAVRKDGRA